jgi:YidC/Oxa1 family membrane protein insertase
MDPTRTVLLIAFCVSLFFLGQRWTQTLVPPPAARTAADVATSAPVPTASAVPSPAPSASPAGVTPPLPDATSAASTAAALVTIETDLLRARIDPRGGDLVQLELRAHGDPETPAEPLELFHRASKGTYIAQSGLIGAGLPNHVSAWRVVEAPATLAAGEDTLTVKLASDLATSGSIEKHYVFRRDSYVIEIRFVGAGGAWPAETSAYFQLVRDDKPAVGDSGFVSTYTGAAWYTEQQKFTKLSFSDITKGKSLPPKDGTDGWIGVVQHYFTSAWLPAADTRREFFAKALDGGLFAVGVIVPATGGDVAMRLYAGPEEQKKLAEIAPGLDYTVDYGMFTVIAAPLFWVLSSIHGFVGNWGIAIILLTIALKLVFFPLSAASYRSMAKMRVVGPKLQKLKEQYGEDRAQLNRAMMELYKTEKINPLGGCLPILVQIPVFIALYWVLLGSVEMRQAPFYGWIHDLSRPDPWFILPILMAVSMYIQTRLNPEPPDPIQAKVMKIMPIAFSVFFFFSPAGLVLYWLVNNILSIAQQWVITKKLEGAAAAAASAPRR